MRDQHVDQYIDLYALGALEPSEQAVVDEHLEGCARCRSLLDESKRMAAILAWTPEQIEPPPELQQRVMARVQQLARAEGRTALPDRPEGRTALPDRPEGRTALTDRPEGRGPERRRSGFDLGGWFSAPGGAMRVVAGLALLAAVLLGGLAWQLQNQASAANAANAELQAELARLDGARAQLAQTNEQLAAENAELARAAAELQPLAQLLREPGTRLVALSDPDNAQLVRGYVVLRPDASEGFVTTASLQPLPDDRTYQFWLVEGDSLESAGTFETDEQGVGRITIQGARPLGDYDAVGISIEPAGGSETPAEIVLVQPLEG